MTEEITRRMLKEQVDAGRDQKDGQACNSVQHPATVPGIMEPMKPFRRPGQETEGHEIPVVAGETEQIETRQEAPQQAMQRRCRPQCRQAAQQGRCKENDRSTTTDERQGQQCQDQG